MVSEPPGVSFRSCETSAVDSGLLSCSESNGSSVVGEADRVGLSVFEGEGSDDEISEGGCGNLIF